MVIAANLGCPRIGPRRQLKSALEDFWKGNCTEEALLAAGRQLRLDNWQMQKDSGLDVIPCNDFSLYDHVLDTVAMVGAVPERFRWTGQEIDLSTYFLMARGASDTKNKDGRLVSAAPMEMTKWFNTNYHFIVPELEEIRHLRLASQKVLSEFVEAKDAGILTRPVILGPVSFLHLGRYTRIRPGDRLVDELLQVYREALFLLLQAGAQSVQIDEPCLALDLDSQTLATFEYAYTRLTDSLLPISLTVYFGPLGANLTTALKLPVQAIHLDLVHGSEDLETALEQLPSYMHLSCGVVDGRNVWRTDLSRTAGLVERIAEKIGVDRMVVAPSCSLLHVPLDVAQEKKLNQIKPLLAFAKQKMEEVSLLKQLLQDGRTKVEAAMAENSAIMDLARQSAWRNDRQVKASMTNIPESWSRRLNPYPKRRLVQNQRLALPEFPTTTIGSFPQTAEIRQARKHLRTGNLSQEKYEQAMKTEIERNIRLQEEIGLDVLVHGEPERTDMVEYFAEQLNGIAVTQHGWVQSYGSRCVKPPLIYGDVSRRGPMTVEWSRFAQEQTSRPVKAMLTGPVTMLKWSFVRDDQPVSDTCIQLALAISEEVRDLEAAGIKVIQIDEPAIREGLPLKRSQWNDYFQWSVYCFRLSSCRVADDTQIHTHMCYSEFGDMLQSIIDMDADVLSIEAARSKMELLKELRDIGYPNEIGPGIYDIHSPRVPSATEMEELLDKAASVISPEKLWINPDCGLKTRAWGEVIPALNAMVQVAINLRQKHCYDAQVKLETDIRQ